jgi:multicomponent Na+:H+ antiporter subunit D
MSLLILAPLFGAALTMLTPGRTLAWIVAAACAAVAASAAIRVSIGALLADSGIAPDADGVALFAAPLVAVNMLIAVLAAGRLHRRADGRAGPFVLALILAVGGGWTGALFSRSLVEMFLAIEAASIACVGLAALSGERERGALNGALRMLSASGLGGAILLLGVGMVERGAGVTGIHGLPLAQIAAPDMCLLGVTLIIVALALKAGLAPLHVWVGPMFGRGGDLAPLVIGAVNAVGAVAVLMRVAASALQAPAIGAGVAAVLAALGGASIIIGSLQAVGATNVRRLCAYCIAAQGGGVLVAAALGSIAGFSAALLQLFALAAMAAAMFSACAVAPGEGPRSMSAIDGMASRAPLASAALALSALSAMGAPLTVGFLGRWRLMEAGIGAGWWWIAAAAVAASLAGVFYGGRLIERVYLRRAAVAASEKPDLWRFSLAPGLAASVVAIAVAISPQALVASAAAAAHIVMGGAQ